MTQRTAGLPGRNGPESHEVEEYLWQLSLIENLRSKLGKDATIFEDRRIASSRLANEGRLEKLAD